MLRIPLYNLLQSYYLLPPKRVTLWKKEAVLALKHLEETGEKIQDKWIQPQGHQQIHHQHVSLGFITRKSHFNFKQLWNN